MSRNLEAVLQPGPVQWLVASDKDSKACSALAPPAPAEVEEFCEEVVKKKEVIK